MNPSLRLRAWGLALLFGVGLIVTQPKAGGADSPFGAVDARASADALRVGVAMTKFLIVENFVDAGGPTAQARLTSTGAESFAALPDPGGLVLNYNTFVGLATGSGLPFDYPFYAQAKFPGSPEAAAGDPSGAYRVAAKTAADSAEALAQMQPTAGDVVVSGAVAHSAVKVEGSAVTATSETRADLVTLAKGALKVSGVVSRSVTTRTAGQAEPKTETSLAVDLITVGDKRIRYGPGGFEFLGTPVPVPSGTVADALAGALKPLGLQVGIVRPETVTGGMKAAVLELRQSYPLPAGESHLVLRFGGATSSVSAEDAVPAPAVGGAGPPADLGAGPSDSGPSPLPSAAESAPPGANGFSVPTGTVTSPSSGGSGAPSGFPVPAPAASGPTDSAGSATTAPGAAPPVGAPVQSAAPAQLSSHRKSVDGPYAALVAGGLAIVLLGAIWARRSAAAAAAIWAAQ